MAASFLIAAVPEPVRIFGLQLLPLSLGRYRLLKRFDCSFVADGPAEASMPDLLLGILICSMRCQEFLEFIEGPKAQKEIKRWSKRIQKEIAADRHFSIYEKFSLFANYIARASEIPKYWEEEQGGVGSGAHWSVAVEVVLRGELGYSNEEIEEGALSKSLLDYFKWAEGQGAIRLMTEWEIDQIAAAEAADLEAQRQQLQAAEELGVPAIAGMEEVWP